MADKKLKVEVDFKAHVNDMVSGISKVLKMTESLSNAFGNLSQSQRSAFMVRLAGNEIKHQYNLQEEAFKQAGITDKYLAQTLATEEKYNQIRLTQDNKASNDLINIWEKEKAQEEIINTKSLANSIKFDENKILNKEKTEGRLSILQAQEQLATTKHTNALNEIEAKSAAKILYINQNEQSRLNMIAAKGNESRQTAQLKHDNKALEEWQKHNNKLELETLKHNNRMEEKMLSGKNRILGVLGGQNAAILASYLYIFKTILNAATKFVKMLINTLNKSFEVTDNIKGQIARLDIFNESNTPTKMLYEQLVASSLRARAPVDETSNLVNNILASGIFDNDLEKAPQRAINLSELVSKSLAINKLNTGQVSSVLLQLSQGLAQGNLQGQELRIIRQNAPYLLKMVTEGINKLDLLHKGTEVTVGDIKELGSTGELTAEVFIQALNAMSDEINSTFANVPKTWKQSISEMKTLFSMFLSKLSETDMPLDRINEKMAQFIQWLESPASNEFWESIGSAAIKFFGIMELGFDAIINGTKWLGENLNTLSDVLIALGIVGGIIFAKPLLYTSLIIFALKTIIDTLTKIGNVVNIVFGGAQKDTESLIIKIEQLFDVFNKISNFISNTLTAAFSKLGATASGVLSSIAIGLGRIMDALGIDIGASLINWGNSVSAVSSNFNNEADKYLGYNKDIINAEKYKNVTDSWYRTQQAIKTDNSNIFKNFGTHLNKLVNGGGFNEGSYSTGGLGVGTTGDALNTYNKGGSVNADIKEEDIKLLKDIATKEYLINVSTITPTMTNNFGDIKETADINAIMDELNRMLEEDLATSVVMG